MRHKQDPAVECGARWIRVAIAGLRTAGFQDSHAVGPLAFKPTERARARRSGLDAAARQPSPPEADTAPPPPADWCWQLDARARVPRSSRLRRRPPGRDPSLMRPGDRLPRAPVRARHLERAARASRPAPRWAAGGGPPPALGYGLADRLRTSRPPDHRDPRRRLAARRHGD